MKLTKAYLLATVPLFVAAMGYNIWYFTLGDAGAAVAPPVNQVAANAASGPSVAGEAAPTDPTQIPAVVDVVLDRLPSWRRNPFAGKQPPPVAALDAPVIEAAQPEQEPDVVVAAILYSADQRRALVNGRTVRIGDRVGTATIVDILPNAIVIESPAQGRRTISQRRGAPTRSRGR